MSNLEATPQVRRYGRLCWEPHKLQVGAESSSTLIPQPTRPWSEDFEGAIEDLSLILPPRAEHVGRRGPDGSCCPPIRPPLTRHHSLLRGYTYWRPSSNRSEGAWLQGIGTRIYEKALCPSGY